MPTLSAFPLTVHPGQALSELARHDDAWIPDQQKHMNMRPYRDTQSIALRASIGRLHTRFEDLTKTGPTTNWTRLPACARIATDLAEIMDTSLGRVTIIAISPQGMILPHCIAGAYANEHAHCIVALQTPASRIICGGEQASLNTGECWSIDNKKTTAIRNLSDEWHIHVAIDVAQRDLALRSKTFNASDAHP